MHSYEYLLTGIAGSAASRKFAKLDVGVSAL